MPLTMNSPCVVEVERQPLVFRELVVRVLGAAAVDHFAAHRQILEKQAGVVVHLPLPPLPPRGAAFGDLQELALEVLGAQHLLVEKSRGNAEEKVHEFMKRRGVEM